MDHIRLPLILCNSVLIPYIRRSTSRITRLGAATACIPVTIISHSRSDLSALGRDRLDTLLRASSNSTLDPPLDTEISRLRL